MSLYLPPGTPPDLAPLTTVRRPGGPLRPPPAWAARLLAWQDRRRGWLPGPDGRLRPPPTPPVHPAVLLGVGLQVTVTHRPRGIVRRVLRVLFTPE